MSYKKTREPLPYLSIAVLSLFLTVSPTLPTVYIQQLLQIDQNRHPRNQKKQKKATFLWRRSMIKLLNAAVAFLSFIVVFLFSKAQVEDCAYISQQGVWWDIPTAARKLDLLHLLLFYAHYRYYLNLSVTDLIRYQSRSR